MEKKTTICEWINTSTQQNWHVYCTRELLAINSKRTISPETPTLCICSLSCLPRQLKIEMHLTVMLLKNLLIFLFSSYSFNFASCFFLLHRSDMIQSSYSSVYLTITIYLFFSFVHRLFSHHRPSLSFACILYLCEFASSSEIYGRSTKSMHTIIKRLLVLFLPLTTFQPSSILRARKKCSFVYLFYFFCSLARSMLVCMVFFNVDLLQNFLLEFCSSTVESEKKFSQFLPVAIKGIRCLAFG